MREHPTPEHARGLMARGAAGLLLGLGAFLVPAPPVEASLEPSTPPTASALPSAGRAAVPNADRVTARGDVFESGGYLGELLVGSAAAGVVLLVGLYLMRGGIGRSGRR